MAFVDVQIIDGLALPYLLGAESGLSDPALDPSFLTAWQGLLATFPGLTLQPLFAAQPVAELADIVDAIRIRGDEPPNPFRWFTIACDQAVVDTLVPALLALPLVAIASARLPNLPALTVSYGTNPDFARTLQIQAAPHGIDAIHVWQVAGGTGDRARLADIEKGWNTNHEELLTARIHSPSGFVADTVADGGHGTSVAGILVGADNGLGTIGIVPDAELTLVVDDGEATGPTEQAAAAAAAIGTAARITAAAQAVGAGGVLLIEEAVNFFARPATPDGNPDLRADILVEFQPAIQTAIRLATLAGVTVIEPAGNGGVDLDAFPFLAHTRPDSPTFSNAVVVGAGELVTGGPQDSWQRTFSSFGARVDCFAAGSLVRAPSSSAPNAYLSFGGTSGASAIIAGVAAAIQSMSVAATGAAFRPADVRRLLSDPTLGTEIPPAAKGGIGSMPDLRKVARAQGFARVLPVGAATTADNAMVIAFLDNDDHLVRRHWLSAWGAPLPLPSPDDQFPLTPDQPAVNSTAELDPVDRLVHDAYLMGPLGIHHYFWDSINQSGDLTKALQPTTVTPAQAAAQGRSLAAVRANVNQLVIAAISPQGRLVVMIGDPDVLATSGVTDPLVLSATAMFRRTAGPAIVSRGPSLVDIVAIEDGGGLSWFTGTTLATIGTGFSAGPPEPTGTEFVPGGRPALLVVGDVLLVAAVGVEGFLRVTSIDPVARTIGEPVVVDVQATINALGPLALGIIGTQVVALGVDTEGVLRTATRPIAGTTWTQLTSVKAPQLLSSLGGVTAVSMSASGVMALVVGSDGTILSSLSKDGTIWPMLVPLD